MSRDNTCHCCEPEAELTPVSLYNRPGLTAIAYRVGTFAQFRQAMLQGIARRSELRGLSTRDSDDYAITILEAWAAVGDVLSFYQERTANEAFLGTATLRGSVQRLAALLGYRLNPGLAAVAYLAFTVERRKALAVPTGLRVQSVPEQDEKPQKYETLEAIDAYGWLNELTVYPAPIGANPLAQGRTQADLAPEADGLAALDALAEDDRLLLFDLSHNPEELVVQAVDTEGEHLRLRWRRPVQGGHWTVTTPVFKRARTFKLFGYNVPAQYPKPTQSGYLVLWNLTTIGTDTPGDDNYALAAGDTLHLDGRYEDLEVGARLLMVEAGGQQHLLTIAEVGEAEQKLGPLSDTVTAIKVTPSFSQINDRRKVVLHELLGDPVRFWGYGYPETLAGSTVCVPGRRVDGGHIVLGREVKKKTYTDGEDADISALEPGRQVLLQAAGKTPVLAEVASVAVTEREVVVQATGDDPYTAAELKLDEKNAQRLTGWCTPSLVPFPTLSASAPALNLRVNGSGPYSLSFASKPADLNQAASQLQSALRGVDPDDAVFAGARVLPVGGRLVVLAGEADTGFQFEPADADETTVVELGLDGDSVRPVTALLSGPLAVPLAFTSVAPQVSVSIGPVGPRTLHLAGGYTDLISLAGALQDLLRGADLAPAFCYAQVLVVGSRLLIVPDRLGLFPRGYLKIELQQSENINFSKSASLLGNIALASHGETQKDETLGDGDPATPFQSFTLKKDPVTHVPSAASTGGESSLQVLVNGMQWSEVDSLYGRGGNETVYTTRVDDEGKTVVRFGDGETGARPPAGRGNIVARYRQGLGLDGRVGAGSIKNALDKPKGLKGVSNPAAAEGGADPETLEEARSRAPATVRTFGRAVSLRDLEDLVRESGEVAKAKATWVWSAGRRSAHLTVAGQEGAAFSPAALSRLHAGLTAQRDPNRPLRLDNYLPLPVEVAATLTIGEAYVASEVAAAARAALEAMLSFEAQPFGQPVHLSDVYAVLQGATGVVAVDMDRLMYKRPATMSEAAFQDFLNQRAVVRRTDGSVAPLQPHLRIYPARPDRSGPPWVRPAEQARLEVPAEDVVLLTQGGLPD
ncbi:MAG TPA: putative baseplate assembly protein [Gammaproteobacteria bacterium]|nr:putative baseplate assembly protein [Gammaproteobacteria bacterium]